MAEDNWADKTTVYTIPHRSNANARVYRVKTASSEYLLGVFQEGARKFAILRGMSRSVGHEIDLRDGDPRIGDDSLYDVPPERWAGKRIDMAGTKTSAVESAKEETNSVQTDVISRTLLLPPSQPAREPPPSPYHVDRVECIEALGSVLRRLANDRATLNQITADPSLAARLKVALTNIRIASDDVARIIAV